MIRYYVLVSTPDGERVFDPALRSQAEAEAIAESARRLSAKQGWRLSYRAVSPLKQAGLHTGAVK